MKMNIIYLIFVYTSVVFLFSMKIDSFSIFNSLRREVRFTKFDIVSLNKSFITISESTIKQFYDKQMLFYHILVHTNITEINASFSVFKCKEHYIDCVNVVSYDVFNLCSKLKLFYNFVASNNTNVSYTPLTCPLYGEYYYKNMTFEADKFGSMFSFPTERYWENYWKSNVLVYTTNRIYISSTTTHFYFIQFRSRNRKS